MNRPAKEKRQVKTIASILDRAGRLYQSKKFEACKDKIDQAQAQIEQLSASADAELLELIKPEYTRLANAHKLLTEQGLEMTALKPLPSAMTGDGEAVSFIESVAPILVSNCGQCHVRRNRGEFSAASYTSLMQSTHIAVGLANESRLIEVIVDGDMPPDGNVAKKTSTRSRSGLRKAQNMMVRCLTRIFRCSTETNRKWNRNACR